MVLNSEELSLLHGLVNGIQNTSAYGYEVAVKGTVVDGMACLVCGIITILVGIYATSRLYKWAKQEEEASDGSSYAMAFLGVLVVLLAIGIVCSIVIYDPFMKIFAPEYTVIKQILEAAASTAN